MSQLAISISIFLGVILLLCAVLDRLGMGDIVKNAGDRVREKAGWAAASVNEANAPSAGFTNEIERLMGFPLREIRTQPVKMQQVAIKRIRAKIDALKELQIRAIGSRRDTEWNMREKTERREKYLQVLSEAKVVLENPDTSYPVKVGNIVYLSRRELLEAAVDMRNETETLEKQIGSVVKVPSSAVENERIIREYIAALEKTLDELESIPQIAEADAISKGVAAEGKNVGAWTSISEQIKAGVDPIKEKGTHDPTDEELMRKAFAQ